MSPFKFEKSGKKWMVTFTTSVTDKELEGNTMPSLLSKVEKEIREECVRRGFIPPEEVVMSGQQRLFMRALDFEFRAFIKRKGATSESE
jgi:hypothetical protein